MITKSSFVRKSIFEGVFPFRHYQINTGLMSLTKFWLSMIKDKMIGFRVRR